MRISLWLLTVLVGYNAFADSVTLLQEITEKGVVIRDEQSVVLPKPSLQPAQDAAARREVLDDLAGGRGWKHFSRKSISAPVAIKLQYVRDAGGQRIGHQVHSAFIVHASLEVLKDQELMEHLFLQPQESENTKDFAAGKVDTALLETAGIESVSENETYGTMEMPLLNRVLVRGVMRTQRLVAGDSVTLAWEIDPRFTGDPANGNTWVPIEKDDSGEVLEGEKRPYRGAGGYMHISKLTELENACLVETQFVLHEPPAWFRGSNMLRSKLPILLQENAKRFRRKLMER